MRSFTDEERYIVWLCRELSGNARLYTKLALFYGDAKGVFEAASSGELEDGASSTVARKLRLSATEKGLDAAVGSVQSDAFGIMFEHDDMYPELLRSIIDPPPMLFYKGNPHKEMAFPFGIVGSRRCTPYGKEMATRFSAEMCRQGITVVSGLADGIDSCAARGALSETVDHLPTVGVLGCGIDMIYPAGNGNLYAAVEKDGLILSEYFPGEKPLKEHFPTRNRIISGMSKGLLVVEAAEHSGTSITAGLALDQGRDVFAIPGRITDFSSAGTNRMIRDGEAKAVLCAEDILSEYAFERIGQVKQAFDPSVLTEEQKSVYDVLLTGEKSFDELATLTGLSVPVLNSVLTELLFLGIMNQLPGRIYMVDLTNI